MKNKTVVESVARNLIGNGTIIKGDIESSGDIRIDGVLTGSIRSNGKIVVGQSGVIEGEMNCQQADISGRVNAKLYCEELTALKASAVFSGELVTARLSIEVGAVFSGKCDMKLPEPSNNDAKK
jgi:cytoskeletal protein CcmA (bactofilin family)